MTEPVRYAAGFVLVSFRDGVPYFLLLRNARHRTWGFPKGHRDDGEDDLACALRELGEETGLAPRGVASNFEHVASHEVDGAHKVVRYFLAESGGEDVRLSAEHDRAAWLRADDAMERLQFENLRKVLRAAVRRLDQRPGENS